MFTTLYIYTLYKNKNCLKYVLEENVNLTSIHGYGSDWNCFGGHFKSFAADSIEKCDDLIFFNEY